MISLLGALIGFSSSIIPEILGYFKQAQANKQELAMLEAKAKFAQQLSDLKIKELDAQAEIEETKGLYAHDRSIDAGGFINGLRGSVRPVLTYAFFFLFAATKTTLVFALVQNQNVDWTMALEMAWDSETQAIFSAIIAFWFGNRAMTKARTWIENRK